VTRLIIVTLKTPREDWAATDPPRIFCRIIGENYPNRYKLQTAHGLLNNHDPVNALLHVPEATGINISISTSLCQQKLVYMPLPPWYLPVIELAFCYNPLSSGQYLQQVTDSLLTITSS